MSRGVSLTKAREGEPNDKSAIQDATSSQGPQGVQIDAARRLAVVALYNLFVCLSEHACMLG